ncbi:MAG: polyphosphate kinase 1 [Bacteroidota bacterium]
MPTMQFTERDISWLAFNQRVLQEAQDDGNPLYERLKFLAIYSSNLDEFFRVRVSSMRRFEKVKKKTRRKLEIPPKKVLKEIMSIVATQQEAFGKVFRDEILPGLADYNIHLVNELEYTEEQEKFVRKFFHKEVQQHLTVQFFDNKKSSIFLQNKQLYLLIDTGRKTGRLAVVNIPSTVLDRFVVLPASEGRYCISFLDDLIRYNLAEWLASQKINSVKGAYAMKLSRDAELYLEDEFSGDLIQKLKESLGGRDTGLPTRFLYDQKMPAHLLDRLKTAMGLSKYDLVPGARYHNFNDFFGFPDPSSQSALHDLPMPPHVHPELSKKRSLLQAIKKKDYILHFPYQKYDYVSQLIREAAKDPKVEQIKITLYRVASKSAVTTALLKALDKGKEVTVFIEAKARFDETSNLYWGEQLEKAGAKVIYSYPGIKVHTKLLLICRRERKSLRYYAYLGTGNFNEKTAKLYCDHALLTADPRLATEALQVFQLLEHKIIVPITKHILVSPFTSRIGMERLIDKEISNAEAGKPAYMILKMNSLEDQQLIEKLYEASQAGVQIQLIVRGICCLVPGQPGLSDNIRVISLVDRFLEHARVYIFGNGGKEKLYLASADWMTRNMDRRVEVIFPIYDPAVFQELRTIVDLQLTDNVKARLIDAEQTNAYVRNDKKKLRAQMEIYQFLNRKLLGK